VTDLAARQEKVNELQQGKVIPLTSLYLVRVWNRDPDILAARVASLKNAFISMGGAVIHHATIPENARQLFFQTWPGWTFGTYRVFDLAAEDSYLADMIPWSATFTGHLDGAEAIYNGARGNLVGVRTRLGNMPQHGVLFGMTWCGEIRNHCRSPCTDRTSVRIQVDCRGGPIARRPHEDARMRPGFNQSERGPNN